MLGDCVNSRDCMMNGFILLLVLGLAGSQDIADCSWEPEGAKLSCNIKTLQTGPAVIPQVENSASLLMRCSEGSIFYESVIKPDQFGTLPTLTSLDIRHCKVRNLPDGAFIGLRNLKKLRIQGESTGWDGSITLQLQQNSLKNLDSLESLELSASNLWGLGARTLCSTPLLTTLNLTRNNIVEVSEVGLTEAVDPRTSCQLLHLKSLDLSYNKISSFLPRDLSLAPGIQNLNLRGNRIAVLSDQTLTGLWSLGSLDLSSNQLAAIPPTFFHQASNLKKLYLENNTISTMSEGVFSGLENLLLLNISRNLINSETLTQGVLSNLNKLVALDLSNNLLTSLPSDLFTAQQSLRILNLQRNQISNVSSTALKSLINLHILLLSENRFSILPPALLDNLAQLSSLSLDSNELGSVPTQLLSAVPRLQDLALNRNLLREVPEGIKHLPLLRTLDLGENLISKLPSKLFWNLTKLYGLGLAGNQLETVGKDVFLNNTELNVLTLSHNNISTIEQNALTGLTSLKALRLDSNRLRDINGLVATQKNLTWMNVSENQIQWFDFAFIPKSLEWLDIHNNKIDRIGNYYSLTTGFKLETLDASYNRIAELAPDALLHSLKNLYLNNNRINKVAPGSFINLENLTRVELQGNLLAGIDMESLALKYTDEVPEFLLGGNPWQCDCELEWFKRVNQLAVEGTFPRVLDLDTVLCTVHGANESLQQMTRMRTEEFLCQYDAHCIPECYCCDFLACDCRMQCPDGCSCFHDTTWSNNMIQCTGRGHMDVPPLIPMDATAVYLDGNNMTELINPGFIGRRRLRAVYLNNSMIHRITNYSFEGLSEVRILHLEDNQLEELVGNEFIGLNRLKELYLQNNFLTRLGADTFSSLLDLALLRLDGNLLTSFPVWELAGNPMLVGLYLARNMWSCDCDFVRPFLAYSADVDGKIVDKINLRCVADHFRGEALATMENIVCDAIAPDFQSGKVSGFDYTPILVSVLLAVLIIVIGYLVAFTFRQNIKDWMFRTKAGDKSTVYAGKDKLFDVFISYAQDDSEFVEQNFAQNLEHGTTSYRLCLHQRDFPPTTPLSDTVSVAVETSTRAVVVLSRNYVDNQWNNIRTAFMEAIRTNNTKVIFLQLEDVDLDKASDLKHLLEDSPVVQWQDPSFWNKLRYFLPEPVYLTFHRNVTMRGTLQTSNLYQPVLGTHALEQDAPKPEHPYQASVYSSEHTYHSIDNNHIYHTLDPGSDPNLFQQFQGFPGQGSRVFLNHNLELVHPAPTHTLNRSHLTLHQIPHNLPGHPVNLAIHQVNLGHQMVPNGLVGHAGVPSVSRSVPVHVGAPRQLPFNQSINESPNQSGQQSINHTHTNSTCSSKKLLSGEDGEYIV